MPQELPSVGESVFELDAPKLYRCNVFRYFSGLSRLYIRVFKGRNEAPSFYLFFSDVGYFEGPMNWQSADFRRLSPEDCLSLMGQTGMVEDFLLDDPDTRDALKEAAHLYIVQTPHTTIRIIAGELVMLQKLPDDLR
ncbi:MAG: hypothetical protein ACOYL5_16035 [Phototrophicaceae bacterium]|jgi:hypothetical protein